MTELLTTTSVHYLAAATFIGIGATAVLDLWSLFLRRAFNVPAFNFCMVGRWIGHMRTGRFHHEHITKASIQPAECTIGWIVHYLIGITFALITLLVASNEWLLSPTLTPALLVGISTVIMPYFVMQPALGFGIAGAKTPNPSQARIKSLMSHAVFGLGLYLSALVVSSLLPALA